MKYFYFLLCGLVALLGLYSLAGVAFFKWSAYQTTHPKAGFQVIKSGTNEITIVDFTNYRCGYCKGMHDIIKQARALEKNIRYIPRPILVSQKPDVDEALKQKPAALEKLVIAAGIQGKFEDMHNMFMEYPEAIIPETLIEETANLYGIDYAKMVEDSQGEQVQKYLDDNMRDMMGYNIAKLPSYIINKNVYSVSDTVPTLQHLLTAIENETK